MGKPADKPQHKPSRKRALEEVLHSLQDLVNNDLEDETQPESRAPNVLKHIRPKRGRGRPRKHPLPESAQSQPRENYTYSQEQADLFGGKTPPAHPNPAMRDKKNTPPNQPASRPSQAKHGPVSQPGLAVVRSKPTRKPARRTLPEHQAPEPASQEAKSTSLEAPERLDDIPLLTDVVNPGEPDRTETFDLQDMSPEARKIAIKVAAKLNIELRESGDGQQLDIKTIMRLQDLLKEALEPKG